MQGRPAISYYDYSNFNLKFARRNGASWQIETVDSAGEIGQYTSLAVVDGRPAISYQQTFDEFRSTLKYASHDGSMWQIAIVDGFGGAGLYTSLAVIAGGRPPGPAISYYDNSTNDLKYARLEDAEAGGFVYEPDEGFCG
jgi:hypothetical protein